MKYIKNQQPLNSSNAQNFFVPNLILEQYLEKPLCTLWRMFWGRITPAVKLFNLFPNFPSRQTIVNRLCLARDNPDPTLYTFVNFHRLIQLFTRQGAIAYHYNNTGT